ncbi:MAG: flagellar biosynthesis protein FliQ [Bacillota bacterium]|jgi:flagellar biosynthetic protein FliQ|nr:flagellar biosynthesis protein FliQ [Bacillota bacterium]
MSKGLVIEVFVDAIKTILLLSSPMLIIALVVGLVVAIFQATTQIQEQTLAFVPKIMAILLVVMFSASWLINSLIEFTIRVYDLIDVIML